MLSEGWHYAKRYRGTEEPAADCLLLPQERLEWREKLLKQAEGNEEGEVGGTQTEQAAHRKDSRSHHTDSSKTIGGSVEGEPAKEVTHVEERVGRAAKDVVHRESQSKNHMALASNGSVSKQKCWNKVGRRRNSADTTMR